jgi:hypothetical protein
MGCGASNPAPAVVEAEQKKEGTDGSTTQTEDRSTDHANAAEAARQQTKKERQAAEAAETATQQAEKELQNFVVETFGRWDEDGYVRWDVIDTYGYDTYAGRWDGHEGGLLVKCADSAAALGSTVPSRLPLSVDPAFVCTLCCSAQFAGL